MRPKLLLDTHVVVRWLAEPKRLSREQVRTLDDSVRRRQPVGISAITLLELAMLFTEGRVRVKLSIDEIFRELETSPMFYVLPLSIEIAKDAALLGTSLRDPADRVIVATARVHGLRLLTSDERIIEANVVATID